jgi:hypothetical protein
VIGKGCWDVLWEVEEKHRDTETEREASEQRCACDKEATKVAQQFQAKREERERAKVCVRKRGHKSGAAVLRQAGGERERRCACEKEATKVAKEF